jgi:hypothetical protein
VVPPGIEKKRRVGERQKTKDKRQKTKDKRQKETRNSAFSRMTQFREAEGGDRSPA